MFGSGKTLRGTQRITLSAMTISLTLVCIYLAGIIPAGKLGFLFLSSVFVAGLMVERETALALFAFAGTALLGVLIVQDKSLILPYVFFFGHFGIAKEYLERIQDKILCWAVKLLYFNAALALTYFIAMPLLFPNLNLGFPLYWLIIPAQLVFIVYDWLYTRVVHFYIDRIRRLIIH
ncbi:MAG: hypothetical protein ACOYU3_09405 [Bacillota bacterium]